MRHTIMAFLLLVAKLIFNFCKYYNRHLCKQVGLSMLSRVYKLLMLFLAQICFLAWIHCTCSSAAASLLR